MRGEAVTVASWYAFEVGQLRRGGSVSAAGLVDHARRAAQLAEGRELLHVELTIAFHGPGTREVRWEQMRCEDSEGYLIPPLPASDGVEASMAAGDEVMGGVAFALYRDLEPRRLWFDSQARYPASDETILVEVPLPDPRADTVRVELSWQENAVRSYAAALEAALEGAGERPKTATAQLLRAVSEALGLPYRELGNGYAFRVPLAGGRRQLVLVNFAGHDEHGTDLIRFLTLVASAEETGNDRELLRINPRLSHGAVGVVDIGGEALYALSDTQLAATAQVGELVAAVTYLAWRGDELESRLTGGADVR